MKSTCSSLSLSSTHVPPQPSIAERTLAKQALLHTQKHILTNILGSKPGPPLLVNLALARTITGPLQNGYHKADREESSSADVRLGTNDFDCMNVASSLPSQPLPDVCRSRSSNGHALAFPLSTFGGDSEESGVELGASPGAVVIGNRKDFGDERRENNNL